MGVVVKKQGQNLLRKGLRLFTDPLVTEAGWLLPLALPGIPLVFKEPIPRLWDSWDNCGILTLDCGICGITVFT